MAGTQFGLGDEERVRFEQVRLDTAGRAAMSELAEFEGALEGFESLDVSTLAPPTGADAVSAATLGLEADDDALRRWMAGSGANDAADASAKARAQGSQQSPSRTTGDVDLDRTLQELWGTPYDREAAQRELQREAEGSGGGGGGAATAAAAAGVTTPPAAAAPSRAAGGAGAGARGAAAARSAAGQRVATVASAATSQGMSFADEIFAEAAREMGGGGSATTSPAGVARAAGATTTTTTTTAAKTTAGGGSQTKRLAIDEI